MKPDKKEVSPRILELFKKPRKIKLSEMQILGLLTYENMSGYDIYKTVEKKVDWLASFVNLNKATVYNTLARMEKRGLISVAEKIEDEKKPSKYIYEITQEGKEHMKELLFKDGDTYPFLFTNTYFDYVFYNTLDKDEIRRLVNRRIQQMEYVAKLFEIFVKYNQGTVPGLVFESERRMYEDMLETSKELLRLLDEKSIEKLYDVKYMVGNEKPVELYELIKE